jgi:hypothetical protein
MVLNTGFKRIIPALIAGSALLMSAPSLAETGMERMQKNAPSNWGKWGENDEVGALNLLGNEQVLQAAKAIRSGKTSTLQIHDPRQGSGLSRSGAHHALHVPG